jgi:hypothetical protein
MDPPMLKMSIQEEGNMQKGKEIKSQLDKINLGENFHKNLREMVPILYRINLRVLFKMTYRIMN